MPHQTHSRRLASSASTLAALLVLLALSPTTSAQTLDHVGDEFLLAYLHNLPTPVVELHLTGAVATTVSIEYPVLSPSFTTTVSVTPGSTTVVTLPSEAAQAWVPDSVMDNAVSVSADDPISVHMVNRRDFTSDGALGLPIDALGISYFAVDADMDFTDLGGGQIVIVATLDCTTVTITPTVDLEGGHLAGISYQVQLDRGEGYLAKTPFLAVTGLTGTRIQADQPVAVLSGSQCADVPLGESGCDHLFGMAPPVPSWGQQTLVAHLPGRPAGPVYRVLSYKDNTKVKLDGVPLAGSPLDAGEYLELGPLPGDHLFSANRPVLVTQYMTGKTSPGSSGHGDPSMAILPPIDQYQSDLRFSTFLGGLWSDALAAEHFAIVFAQNGDTGTITLDGGTIGAGAFAPIGTTGFSVATLALAAGSHRTVSAGVHATLVGGQALGLADSYLHPAGRGLATGAGGPTLWNDMAAGAINGVRALLAHDGVGGEDALAYVGGDPVISGLGLSDHVVRFDGSAWQALGLGTNDTVRALAVFEDELYVGGDFSLAGVTPAAFIARWDGSDWFSVGGGMNGSVRALTVHDDGTGPALFAGGDFTLAGGLLVNHIAVWDGASWAALGSGIAGVATSVRALTSHDDGSGAKLIAGGDFLLAGTLFANNVAVWSGGAWAALGPGLTGSVRALASTGTCATGELTAGGLFPGHVSRYDGATWTLVGGGTDGPVHALSEHFVGVQPRLVAAGQFGMAGATPTSNISLWNGSSWSSLGTGTDLIVQALSSGKGDLFAGGEFTVAGGLPVRKVARWGCATVASPIPFIPTTATPVPIPTPPGTTPGPITGPITGTGVPVGTATGSVSIRP